MRRANKWGYTHNAVKTYQAAALLEITKECNIRPSEVLTKPQKKRCALFCDEHSNKAINLAEKGKVLNCSLYASLYEKTLPQSLEDYIMIVRPMRVRSSPDHEP